MNILITRYSQRNKETKMCKRYMIQRGHLVCLDVRPIPDNTLPELTKGKNVMFFDVEKLTDLDFKTA